MRTLRSTILAGTATLLMASAAMAFGIWDCLDDLEDVFPYNMSHKVTESNNGDCGKVITYQVYAHHGGSKTHVASQTVGRSDYCGYSAPFKREVCARKVCDKAFINLGQPQCADYWP